MDELDGKELVENRDAVLEKREDNNHESAKIKTRKVGGSVRFAGGRQKKPRIRSKAKCILFIDSFINLNLNQI